ncbi:MAG TPA: family 1 glycosylhydrolase, partial [Friedmanniella sp.]
MSAFDPGAFTWALGIEDTCVYPADPSATSLDEHELTDHTRARGADLALAAGLGATALRYGASWPLVHVAPGTFVWDQLDEAVDHAERLGLELVVDLVHYGTPPWLTHAFADPGYPAAIEEFARALITRYRGRVRHLTPLNEPLTTASFCGLRGVWPPYRTGWDGWVAVVVPMALGVVRTARAARETDPEVQIVHVEASTLVSAADPPGAAHADLLRDIGWLPTDLMLGRVGADHPMREWLLEHGAREADLDWLAAHPT